MFERFSLLMAKALTLDLKREDGQAVTEYGIVLAFVAIALVAVLVVLHAAITTWITQVGTDIKNIATSTF